MRSRKREEHSFLAPTAAFWAQGGPHRAHSQIGRENQDSGSPRDQEPLWWNPWFQLQMPTAEVAQPGCAA